MSEKKIIVEESKLEYEGPFDLAELYKLVDRWTRENWYDKIELKNLEQATAEGKYIEIDLKPYRTMSDYVKFEMRIRIRGYNLKDVEIERDGKKYKMQQGRLLIIFDAWLVTDYMGRWESNPYWFFIRTVFDKFFYRGPLGRMEEGLVKDVTHLQSRIKAFLNLYKYY